MLDIVRKSQCGCEVDLDGPSVCEGDPSLRRSRSLCSPMVFE